jgi:site-specific recombinase XerD
MKAVSDFPSLLEGFFTKRLMAQRRASSHTIGAYRDTFRLLLQFAEKRLGRPPSRLELKDLQPTFIASFLDDLEQSRANGTRSRNARLAAIRSFFQYAALEAPEHSALIQRVLAIPRKRCVRPLIDFLLRPEIEALLAAVDRSTWLGRRDYAFLRIATQTGLRLSEMTGLRREDVVLGVGAHVHCEGKGRKMRATPLTKNTANVLSKWIKEQASWDETSLLFPSSRGGRLSADAVQYLVAKYAVIAQRTCGSLTTKRITPHVLRHTAAMELLLAGVDRALIAIWLGHESVETTQIYLDANLELKEEILAKTRPLKGRARLFRPGDRLLAFLKNL